MSCVKFRPLSSSWLISFPVTTPDTSDDCVSICATLEPSTVISVELAPTCNELSTRAFCATRRMRPFTSYFLKPCAATVRSYFPGVRAGADHSPSLLLTVVRLMPCSPLVTVTCALATAAPVGSVTVPVREAVSCPSKVAGADRRDKSRISHTREDFILHPIAKRRGLRSLALSDYLGHPHGGFRTIRLP